MIASLSGRCCVTFGTWLIRRQSLVANTSAYGKGLSTGILDWDIQPDKLQHNTNIKMTQKQHEAVRIHSLVDTIQRHYASSTFQSTLTNTEDEPPIEQPKQAPTFFILKNLALEILYLVLAAASLPCIFAPLRNQDKQRDSELAPWQMGSHNQHVHLDHLSGLSGWSSDASSCMYQLILLDTIHRTAYTGGRLLLRCCK